MTTIFDRVELTPDEPDPAEARLPTLGPSPVETAIYAVRTAYSKLEQATTYACADGPMPGMKWDGEQRKQLEQDYAQARKGLIDAAGKMPELKG